MRISTKNSGKRIFVPVLLYLLVFLIGLVWGGMPVSADEQGELDAVVGTPKSSELVTITFKETDISEVLNILAYKGHVNIVAGEDVEAKVTVQLKDVPWEQALDIILKTYNFTYRREGNLIRVMSLARKLEEESKIPLVTKIVSLNFADVEGLQASLAKILSKRGTIEVDKRTNSLIVTDVPEMVDKVEEAALRLDTRTPQVLIEAMMVDVKISDLDQWGSALDMIDNHSDPFLSIANESLGGNTLSTAMVGDGTNTFSFLATQDNFNINTVIDFWKKQGRATILANPKVLTLDNQEAKIEIIEEIPYLETVDSGSGTTTNVKFKEAGIKLNVTPHITSGNYISMNVKPEQSFKSSELLGQPIIDKRAAETNLLVRNGQTIVIGGLRQTKDTTSYEKVPFFGDIPYIGLLFRKKSIDKVETELVLFVTPHVIQESLMTNRELELLEMLDNTERIVIDERTEMQRLKDGTRAVLDKFLAKEIEEKEISHRRRHMRKPESAPERRRRSMRRPSRQDELEQKERMSETPPEEHVFIENKAATKRKAALDEEAKELRTLLDKITSGYE